MHWNRLIGVFEMMSVTEAVNARRSTRAFLDKPVAPELLRQIFATASRSPSGGNLQPWHAYVMAGKVLEDLKEKVRETRKAGGREGLEYMIFPNPLGDVFNARRRKCGEDLYAAIGVPREDKAGRDFQFARNYEFFGAPVGVIFAIDRQFGHAQWVHMGMFIQTVMLVAQEAGLATCAQEAWAGMHKTVGNHLGLPPEQMVYCGLALGYADDAHPINGFTTDRMPLDELAQFRGF
jgi:nitroreductase